MSKKEIERYITVERNGELVAIDNPEYVKKIQNEKYEYFLNKSGIPIIILILVLMIIMVRKIMKK